MKTKLLKLPQLVNNKLVVFMALLIIITSNAFAQCPPGYTQDPVNLNSPGNALNTELQVPLNTGDAVLNGLQNGLINFKAEIIGTGANWGGGIQIQNNSGVPGNGDFIYAQPENTTTPLSPGSGSYARYTFDLTSSIPNASFTIGGLNNNDMVVVYAYNNGVAVPIDLSMITNIVSGSGVVATDLGNEVSVNGSGSTGGTDPLLNTFTILIPSLVDSIVVNSGKSTNSTSTVTIGMYGFTGCVPPPGIELTGNVFNDINGLTDATVNGAGFTQGTVNAVLVDNAGNVVAVTPVSATGTYTFSGVTPGNYTVQLNTTSPSVGAAAPAPSLPTDWVSTGENNGTSAGNDGIIDAKSATITVASSNISDINFGIQQPPTAGTNTAASVVNPGGTTSASVPASTFSGSDFGTGTVDSIKITALPSNATSITIDGVTYDNSNFPAAGITLAAPGGVPTLPISIDPIDGAVTAAIPYVTIDNAGFASPIAGVANVPFTGAAVGGCPPGYTQDPVNLNSPGLAMNTDLTTSSTGQANLNGLQNGLINFKAEIIGAGANWNDGIEVQNNSGVAGNGDFIYAQPENTSTPLSPSSGSYARYTFDLTSSIPNASFTIGGLNFNDMVVVFAYNNGVAIPLDLSMISNIVVGSGIVATDLGNEVSINGSGNSGGTNPLLNTFTILIPSLVDSVVVNSGKSDNGSGTVTIGMYGFTGCVPPIVTPVAVTVDPDINVTYVNVPVDGDMNTNDENIPTGSTYTN
ncbi:MAG TPA: hypothetical protein PLU17_07255, partial [Chitinophagaceae bacterium]|nr:hypothetical protein [Chitinophagaceae bacterium]